MNSLNFEVETSAGVEALSFSPRRMFNLGYSGRQQSAVRAHIEELAQQGIPPPPRVPCCFPVAARQLTLDDEIEVLPGKSSGEAEVVLIMHRGAIHVGVGSDHTDRDLEAINIEKSKQICPNVVSRRLWSYADVKERWDELVLSSHIARDAHSTPRLYQRAPLSALLAPERLLAEIPAALQGDRDNGLVVFSGTIPLLGEFDGAAGWFSCELADARSGRKLTASYGIRVLASA